jgi:predicted double-glycine peptidase
MNLWLAAAVSLLCALSGVALGWWFSRLRSPYWLIGYLIPLVLVLGYALGFYVPTILFLPPFSWMFIGIKKFATLGFVAALVLTAPLSRVSHPRNRIMIVALMVVVVFSVSIWPFLAPITDRAQLSGLKTNVDKDGVCLQTTSYTCGPAAAVTALRKLGLPAEEGRIAILSCTSDQEGTPTDMLASGLQNEYGKEGLAVKCQVFKNIAALKQAGLTLAVVKYGLFEDHWMTVLEVTDSEVIIGDPLAGLTHFSHDDFCRRWRFIGIVLQRKTPV